MPDPSRIASTVDAVRAAGQPVLASSIPGVSRGRVRAALSAGALVHLRRGIVVASADWLAADPARRHLLAVRAALMAYPGAWASHTSATQLHGVTVLAPRMCEGMPTVHISRTGTTLRAPGLVVHGQRVPPSAVEHLDGLPVSSLIRATIEVAARRRLPHAVAVIDAGMRRRVSLDVPDLRRAVHSAEVRERLLEEWDAAVAPYTRHRWVTTVRRAIQMAEPAAESFLESISRVAIVEAGLPRPVCGMPMRGDNGITYWLDFWWDAQRVMGEADGAAKYDAPHALLNEKLRQEALSASVSAVVRWGMDQVVPEPGPMLSRLRAALNPRGRVWL